MKTTKAKGINAMKGLNESQDEAISRVYDTIASIWIKQKRVIDFELCYGDGTKFRGIKKEGVKIIWEEMHKLYCSAHRVGWKSGTQALRDGDIV